MTLPIRSLSDKPSRSDSNGDTSAASAASLRAPGAVKPRRRSRWFLPLLLFILLASGLAAAWAFFPKADSTYGSLIVRPFRRENVQLTVVERGSLESARNADIVCRVKAGKQTRQTTIKWLIDAGTQVVRGQVLARLDDSALVKTLQEQEIITSKAMLDWMTARDQYDLVQSLNETDLETARINLQLAELELKKYLEGDYEQLLKDVRSRILLAEADMEMWNERVAWANRMVKKNFITPTQAEADQSRRRSAQVALDKVKEELRVLKDYTRLQQTTLLKSNIATARSKLKQLQVQARSTESQALNDRDTKKKIYDKELALKKEVEEEIQNCVLRAPQAGLVVYYESPRSRRSAESPKIEVGATVHEGQKMMQIPDLKRMIVNTSVHEALVAHLKGQVSKPTGFLDSLKVGLLTAPSLSTRLSTIHAFDPLMELPTSDELRELDSVKVHDGQRVQIRVDAYSKTLLEGRVKSVATVATKDWFSDVRMYKTEIEIIDHHKGLKPGMSAGVTILTDRKAEDVVAIPVQSVLREAGKDGRQYVYVKTPTGVVKRFVQVGINNEKMVEIQSGLKEGELVAENPQVLDTGSTASSASKSTKGKGGKPPRRSKK